MFSTAIYISCVKLWYYVVMGWPSITQSGLLLKLQKKPFEKIVEKGEIAVK